MNHPLNAVAAALEEVAHSLRGQVPSQANLSLNQGAAIPCEEHQAWARDQFAKAQTVVAQAPDPREPSFEAIERRLYGIVDHLNLSSDRLGRHVDAIAGTSATAAGTDNKASPAPDGTVARLHGLLDHAEALAFEISDRLSRLNRVTKAVGQD